MPCLICANTRSGVKVGGAGCVVPGAGRQRSGSRPSQLQSRPHLPLHRASARGGISLVVLAVTHSYFLLSRFWPQLRRSIK